MELPSSGFRNETTIPRRFTCDGEDVSPPLEWSGAPAGARSFVLLCDDPDAPGRHLAPLGALRHSGRQTGLTEGAVRGAAGKSFKQAINDFRKPGHGGPCPPHLHGIHHYHFRLLALSVDRLPLGAKPSCNEVEREARKHAIAEATLVGLYQRLRS